MNKLIHTFLISIITLGFVGCETTSSFTPVSVQGEVISNPSVGFNGYKVNMPQRYVHYDAIANAGKNKAGDFTHARAINMNRGSADIIDSVTLVNFQKSINFTVSKVHYLSHSFSQLNQGRIEEVVRILTHRFGPASAAYNVNKEVIKIRNKTLGRISYNLQEEGHEFSVIIYFKPGHLREFYEFYGFAKASEASKLDLDLKQMLYSLSF